MIKIDKRKVLILLTVAAAIAMISTITLTTFATNNVEDNTMAPELRRWSYDWQRRCGPRGERFGGIEVSEEYEANAIAIAENDLDVQELIADNYSIKGVRPVIKTMVDANGDVTTEATSAIVMLENDDATSQAAVWVDLDAESVTKIVILTRTVIEKT